MNVTELSKVPNLEVEIDHYGLRWLSQRLGKYALYLVGGFYVTYVATIFRDLAKRKKAID